MRHKLATDMCSFVTIRANSRCVDTAYEAPPGSKSSIQARAAAVARGIDL